MHDFASKTINSWDEFNQTVLGLKSSHSEYWIYRGQPEDWELSSTIERALCNWRIDLKHAMSIEFQTVREFRRRMREPQYHRVHTDTLFCLALMQHHGAPTRLLDCTYSPFVAAAFAMQEGFAKRTQDGVGDRKPVIWCFQGKWCEARAASVTPGKLVEYRNDDRLRSDKTFVPLYQFGTGCPGTNRRQFVKPENPFQLNDRLTTQQGVFLCPADLGVRFVDNLRAMLDWNLGSNVVKLCLDLNDSGAIEFARNLKEMNLSFAALFPGFEGFARSIGQQIFHYRNLAADGAGS